MPDHTCYRSGPDECPACKLHRRTITVSEWEQE